MSDTISPSARVQELRRIIAEHDHAYYVLNNPSIPDETYDQIYRELVDLEKSHPELADLNSPTMRVGNDLTESFEKVPHLRKMLSLEKAFSVEESLNFFISAMGESFDPETEVCIEPKIDGLSLSLHYDGGRLVKAVTRGDGAMGDNVTANARTIRSIPTQVFNPNFQGKFEVRGEVYMTKQVFEDLNKERHDSGQEKFANPRNAAAGTLKLKNPAEVAERKLHFIAYQAFGLDVRDHEETVQALLDLGFHTPNTFKCKLDADVIDEAVKEFTQCRHNYPYEIDGLVIKVNSIATRLELGMGTSTPKWAIAYKFPAERKATKLLAIELTVGRTGQITPNARVEAIQLAGTTVCNASLSNIDEITRMRVDVGDEVIVQKAGEIIPQVVGVKSGGYEYIEGQLQWNREGLPDSHITAKWATKTIWAMPSSCPSCGNPIERHGVHYFCVNGNCKERHVQYLTYALGKGCLDFDGMGEAQVRLVVDYVTQHLAANATLLSILRLTDSEVNGIFKPAMAKKFQKERERIKSAPLWRKLKSLGIDGMGTTNSKSLAARWPNIADIIDHVAELPGIIGKVNTDSLITWVEANLDYLEDLQDAGFVFAEDRKEGPLSGKVFCITGAMASGSRDQVSSRIEAAGGIVKDSVGKKVHYLIVGEGGGKNKSEAAKKNGTKVITEQDLYTMMGQEMPTAAGMGTAKAFEFEQE